MTPKPFIPTYKYLPVYYQNADLPKKICDAVDAVFFKPVEHLILAHAIYEEFQDELVTDPGSVDEVYEQVFSDVYGLSYPFIPAGIKDLIGIDDTEIIKRRIRIMKLVSQVHSLPYTEENFKKFVSGIESLLHIPYGDGTPWLKIERPANNKNVLVVTATLPIADEYNVFTIVAKDVVKIIARLCPCYIYVDFKKGTHNYL